MKKQTPDTIERNVTNAFHSKIMAVCMLELLVLLLAASAWFTVKHEVKSMITYGFDTYLRDGVSY
jgi:hypothetical protein